MSNKDAPQDTDNRPAVGGPDERRFRPLVERLRSRAWEDRQHRKYREEAAQEIERLVAALNYASSGFALAYDAAEKKLNDEVLLHCGHHQSRVDIARAA